MAPKDYSICLAEKIQLINWAKHLVDCPTRQDAIDELDKFPKKQLKMFITQTPVKEYPTKLTNQISAAPASPPSVTGNSVVADSPDAETDDEGDDEAEESAPAKKKRKILEGFSGVKETTSRPLGRSHC